MLYTKANHIIISSLSKWYLFQCLVATFLFKKNICSVCVFARVCGKKCLASDLLTLKNVHFHLKMTYVYVSLHSISIPLCN